MFTITCDSSADLTQELYEKLKSAPTVVKHNYFHILKYIMLMCDFLVARIGIAPIYPPL